VKSSFDFGYKFSNDYQVDKKTELASYSIAFGLYSSCDFYLNMNFFGMFFRQVRLQIVPFDYNPVRVRGAWSHPIAMS
jgi:hypothetical protein